MLDFIVQEGENDQTMISFLKRRFKTTPLSLIYKLFRAKKIKVDGKSIRYYHYRLKSGEKIEIYDNYLEKSSSTIYPLSQSKVYFEVICEDKNVLIVLKEHGITMPSLDNSIRNYLFQKDPVEYQKQVEEFFVVTAVHRLDKVTKGLVIYPKNSVAKRILYRAIADKTQITKKYLALCEGSFKRNLPSYVRGYLRKDSHEQKMIFTLKNPDLKAQHCALEIKKLVQKKVFFDLFQKFASEYRNSTLLEITLHTGRKHQIRSVLSFFGMPIIGDKKYGSKTEMKDKICLFAYKIIFNNLPPSLSYLNGKEFEIEKI
jgi:23S rRNA pseudouridine955/2504/2580 synthase